MGDTFRLMLSVVLAGYGMKKGLGKGQSWGRCPVGKLMEETRGRQ